MATENGEGKCFTFIWNIENIRYSLQKWGARLSSPAFVVDAIEGTKWKLDVYPRGRILKDFIGIYLHRETDSKGRDTVEVKYELAFIGDDGSVLRNSSMKKRAFSKGADYGYSEFQKQEVVYASRRSEYLPHDTLKVRCRIWKTDGQIEEDIRCTALTRIGIEKKYIKWDVENFSTLESGKKCAYRISSVNNDNPLMNINLSVNSEEAIDFEILLQDHSIKFCTLGLFLINATGKKVECNQEEIWFDGPDSCEQLTFSFTKKKLLEEKRLYLPKDTLSLLWEWTFSKGVVSEEIQEDEYACICPEVKMSDLQMVQNNQITLFNVLVDNVRSLYDENFLSDVKLKTNTSEFPAHKFILSASSSVFKAMFSSDMKENNSDCVNIEDLDDDTINRMLLFIYTTRVEGLTYQAASHLYVAADKYEIVNLKNVCSSFLKQSLSPSNACSVLLLADLHGDSDLKFVVQDYILKNGKETSESDEFKVLMQTNAQLAAETVRLLFK